MTNGTTRIRTTILSGVLVLTVLSGTAIAWQRGAPPPLTSHTVKGRWEGITSDSNDILLLEVADEPDSTLAWASGVSSLVYRSKSSRVSGGRLQMVFDTEFNGTVELVAKGQGDEASGIMSGIVVDRPKGQNPLSQAVRFVKQPGGLVNSLLEKLKNAEWASARYRETRGMAPAPSASAQ